MPIAPLYCGRGWVSTTSFAPSTATPARSTASIMSQLLAGSEGTLATVTSATLKLVPKPQITALAVVHFDRLIDACAAIPDILETDPSASELLDKHLIDLARAQPGVGKAAPLCRRRPGRRCC